MTTYKIFSSSKPMSANQQVKRVGQYLYRHIDGAYDYRSGPNSFDVYFILLYELKPALREPDQDYPVCVARTRPRLSGSRDEHKYQYNHLPE